MAKDKSAWITLKQLEDFVDKKAALRVIGELEPESGKDSKIFPPTYTGKEYAETKDKDGKVVAVVLDSPQSQANRMEELLEDAIEDGEVYLPRIVTDLGDDLKHLGREGKISSLTAPHRWADALLRDSVPKNGGEEIKNFHDTPEYKAMAASSWRDASAVFRYCPTSLLFGVWDSHGARGGLGIKYARALTSEITAFGVSRGMAGGGRLDPTGIRKDLPDNIFKKDTYYAERLGDRKAKKPSEVGHGNIAPGISEEGGGIIADKIKISTVISLTALRQLGFGGAERDQAARVVLAAVGIFAVAAQAAAGYGLRSRCGLFTQTPLTMEAVPSGDEALEWNLDRAAALKLLKDSIALAKKAGLDWQEKDIELKALPSLVRIIKYSQDTGGNAGD